MIRALLVVFIFFNSAIAIAAIGGRCDQFFESQASGYLPSAKSPPTVQVEDFVTQLQNSHDYIQQLTKEFHKAATQSDLEAYSQIHKKLIQLGNEWAQYSSLENYTEISNGRLSQKVKQGLDGKSLLNQGTLIYSSLQRVHDVLQLLEQVIAIRNIIDMNIRAKYGATPGPRDKLDMVVYAELNSEGFEKQADALFFQINSMVSTLRHSLKVFLEDGDVAVFERIGDEKENLNDRVLSLKAHLGELYLPFMEYAFKIGSTPYLGDLSFAYINSQGKADFLSIQKYLRVDVVKTPNLVHVSQGRESEVWLKVFSRNQPLDSVESTQVVKIVISPHILF